MSSVIGIDIEESCISHLLSMDEIEYTLCFHKLSGISIKKGSIIASIKTINNIFKFSFDLQTKKFEVTKKEHTDSEFHPLSLNIEENVSLYSPDDGISYEGPAENDNPFGYGSLFNEPNQLVYRGVMYGETKMCFGVEFYPDLGKVEYCGCFFGKARHGFGRLYDRQGELIYEGNWIRGNNNYDTSIVLKDIGYEKIVHNLIHELVIDEGCGNDYDGDLELSGYCYLERLEMRTNSFKNLKSLRICDNPVLKTIGINGERSPDSQQSCSLPNVKSVVIENLPQLTTLYLDNGCCSNTKSFRLSNLPKLISLVMGNETFTATTDVSISNLLSLTSFNVFFGSFRETREFHMENLPNLIIIDTATNSFCKVESVVLKNIPNLKSIDIRSAFRNCKSKKIENASLLGGLPCFKYDPIISIDDFNQSSINIEYLMIGNWCLNKRNENEELKEIDLTRFVNVRIIDIGSNSLQNIKILKISNLPQLTELKIGCCAFYSTEGFGILDLPKLSTFTVGTDSFKNTIRVAMTNLPQLDRIEMGDGSFTSAKDIILNTLPKLKSLCIREESFVETTSVFIMNLPNLTTFNTKGYSLFNTKVDSLCKVESVVLKNIPNLKSIDIRSAFRNCKSKKIENASLLGDLPCFKFNVIEYLEDLTFTSASIEYLMIGNWCLNKRNENEELKEIDLTRFVNVRIIDIGSYSLQNIKILKISNLPQLTELKIGDKSFKETKSFVLDNLPQLNTFTAGDSVFDSIIALCLSNLPNLTTIMIGNTSFSSAEYFTLLNLPNLTTFITEVASFLVTTNVSLENLPKLTTFITGCGSFISVNSIIFKNIPNLKCLDTKSAFRNCLMGDIENTTVIGDHPYLQYDSFYFFKNMECVSDSIECLTIGDGCLNEENDFENGELNEIDLSRFVNARVISIGNGSCNCIKNVMIMNLPNLTECTIGSHSFFNATSFYLLDLPNLTSFTTGYQSFFSLNYMRLSNLPKLNDFNPGNESFSLVKGLVIRNVPNLQTQDLRYACLSNESGEIENASLLTNLPCFKHRIYSNVADFYNNCSTVEYLIIGNQCMLEGCTFIDLSCFVNVKSIDIGSFSCMSILKVVISNLPKLKEIITRFGSFCDSKSLVLENLPKLISVIIEMESFFCTKFLSLLNLPQLTTFKAGDRSFFYTNSLSLENLPHLTSFITENYFFDGLDSLSLINLPSLATFMTKDCSFQFVTSLYLSNLPQLTSFIVGEASFYYVIHLCLSNLPNLNMLSLGNSSFEHVDSITQSYVPFSNGFFTLSSSYNKKSFKSITSSSIKCDSVSSRLKNCIVNINHP